MKIKHYDKNKILLQSNASREVFWSIKKGRIVKRNSISEPTATLRKSLLAERQIYKVYGNRPPYPLTLIKGTYRLLPNLPLQIDLRKKTVLNILDKPLDAIDEKWRLEDYYTAFENAIRTDRKYKIIFMSSGWDSSGILAALVKKYGPSHVVPIILRLNYGLKEPVNTYEIKKAKKICQFFNVQLRIVSSIYFNEKRLREAILALRQNHLFNLTAINHWTLWEAVKKLGYSPKQSAVFAGEYSDGAHNFGFSQNFSAVYPEKGYRQYADKVRTYFISPAFLRRIQNENNISQDQLVKSFMPGKILKKQNNLVALCKTMLIGMFYNDDRGPYTISAGKTTEKSMKNEYFRLMKNIFPRRIEQLYASIIEFYKRHHWQGSTVMGLQLFKPKEYQLKLPFGDKKILALLAKMPTRYGRGLEPESTKYPLKMFCKTQVNYPLEFQEGPHSYVYDTNQSLSLIQILYKNTTLGKMIRKENSEILKGNIEIQQEINNQKEADPKTIEKLIAAFLTSGLIKHDKKN